MLRRHPRTDRRLLLLVPALFVVVAAGCSDDDDDADPNDTVTIGIDGTAPDATTDGTDEDGDSGDNDGGDDSGNASTASTHDIPSLADVGRADFTHTIVAGDFLRKIADTYDVEIDDIVGANEWGVDGRDHLLLPGDEIYLPADAVMPPEAPATTEGSDDGGDDSPQGAAPADPSTVCRGGVMSDTYRIGDDDTLDGVAERLGVSARTLETANAFGFNGAPEFGDSDTILVPCPMNWPRFVEFNLLTDPPVCTDESMQGLYAFQVGDTAESLAATFGITPEQLLAETNHLTDLSDLQAGDKLPVCESWF